eukprot:3501954-Prymnesium_polylepis.2
MFNIVTLQLSPRRSDRIHPDRHRPSPRPESTIGSDGNPRNHVTNVQVTYRHCWISRFWPKLA